jgi:hypothetical protein
MKAGAIKGRTLMLFFPTTIEEESYSATMRARVMLDSESWLNAIAAPIHDSESL